MTQESEISALLQQFPNASPAEILARLDLEVQREVFRHMTKQEMVEFPYAWRKWWARPNQLAPPGEWSNWLVMAGRFFGKTRCGAEWIRERVDAGKARYIAIVGATGDDANYVMVNGPAGIISISPPKKAPEFIKGQLVWPNGATATLFSANEPARLRGPQHDTAWADELGVWRYPEAFSNLELGMRLGTDPRVLITTTPRPTALMKDIIARPDTVVTRGTSYDNRANVAAQIFRRILRYEGTRLGLQELEGRLLEDIPGALWTHDLIEGTRRKQEELVWTSAGRIVGFSRVVIAIDPAVSSGEQSDETGIIVAGSDHQNHAFILADESGRYAPDEWAARVKRLYETWMADLVVGEANNGGDMIEAVLRMAAPTISYKSVKATRGKYIRAEPVSQLYHQRRVHHVGAFPDLEEQMCSFTPDSADRDKRSQSRRSFEGDLSASPDRVDALVWALTDLLVETEEPDYDMWRKLAGR